MRRHRARIEKLEQAAAAARPGSQAWRYAVRFDGGDLVYMVGSLDGENFYRYMKEEAVQADKLPALPAEQAPSGTVIYHYMQTLQGMRIAITLDGRRI